MKLDQGDNATHQRQTELLGRCAALSARSEDFGSFLAEATLLLTEAFSAERVSILLARRDELAHTEALVEGECVGVPDAVTATLKLGPDASGPARQVFESRRPLLGTAAQGTGRPAYSGSSFIVVPLLASGVAEGVVCITNRVDGTAYTPGDLLLAETFAAIIAACAASERHRTELERASDLLDRTIGGLPLGLILVDRDHQITHANRTASILIGCGTLRAGMSIPCDDPEGVGRAIRESIHLALDREGRAVVEWPSPTQSPPPGGRNRPLRITASRHPRTAELLLLIEDVSLSATVEELRRVDEMKTNFISVVSHELRTPITSLRGAAGLLSTYYGQGLDEMQENLVRIVATSSERLSVLVNTIIDVAMIDQQKLVVSPRPGNLAALVREIVEARGRDLQTKELDFQFEVQEGAAYLSFDRERLSQTISAIIDNAIKFSKTSTDIVARLSRDDAGMTRLVIHNEGDPIPREHRRRIFDRFTQLEDALTRRQGGTGLGLYVARQIAMLHGGSLEALDPPTGATFELTLPSRLQPGA